MNKFTIKKRQDRIWLICKLEKNQQLNMRELEILLNGVYEELLAVQIIDKSKKLILQYELTPFISLKRFLENGVTVQYFLETVHAVADTLEEIKQQYMQAENILLEFERIFILPRTRSVRLTYVPIIGFNAGIDIKNFFLECGFKVVILDGKNSQIISDYIRFLKGCNTFSLYDLKRKLGSLLDMLNEKQTGDADAAKAEQTKASGVYEDYSGAGRQLDTGNIMLRSREDIREGNVVRSTQSFGTVVLGEDSQDVSGGGETMVLLEIPVPKVILLRKKDKSTINISKTEFLLGKEASAVDFAISGNNAVSRLHAAILLKEGKVYVVDKKSTNGTFIQEERVEPGVEKEIHSGDTLKLANEEFELHTEI